MNVAPRRTIPKSSSVSGSKSVVETAAKAVGKPVKSTTTTRISQTWFASQIGPMAASTSARCARRRGPEARRSHSPPPKSAPASST